MPSSHGPAADERPMRPPQRELAVMRPLARQFPNIDAAYAEIARLSAILSLPMGAIHIISDVHGEHRKLRHVINNASGTLRQLFELVTGCRWEDVPLELGCSGRTAHPPLPHSGDQGRELPAPGRPQATTMDLWPVLTHRSSEPLATPE
ncbi:MAG: fructose-bisphosphatase class III [Planctomycetaceae bacterium]|nr:fructose-bisphosphatase class III [Planctomycetaceae bacterium]